MNKHPCIDCGKPVQLVSIRCYSCASKQRWQSGQMSHRRSTKGKDHPMWKGGRVMHCGYILIHQPDHPRASKKGYVFEHLLNWEQAHNKPLPEGWVIHHLNGIRSDNRPVNLQALLSMKHSLVLQAKARRIQELEAIINGQSQLL